uniref:Uncharacterized protein n=1 Tax=Anopheles melas TaxID=34690 RepID=A0A182TG57_9DIPT
METTTVPVSEEQPEKEENRRPQQPADGEACAAIETVASTDCTDSRKVEGTEETEKLYAERKENAIPDGSNRSVTEEAKTNRDSADGGEPEEQIVELDSSPEKSTGRTKEDALKSPLDLETYSVDDEEEHEGELVEEEEIDEEEEYDEMDEEYEVYVEEKETVNAPHHRHQSSDDDASKPDDALSTDEYTDEEGQAVVVKAEPKATAPSPAASARKSSSDAEEEEEEEEDDDEVEIISCDDDNEDEVDDDEDDDSVPEDEEEEEDDDEEEEEDVMEEEEEEEERTPPAKVGRKQRADARSTEDSDESSGSPKLKVKYRSYQQRRSASLRKRAVRMYWGFTFSINVVWWCTLGNPHFDNPHF